MQQNERVVVREDGDQPGSELGWKVAEQNLLIVVRQVQKHICSHARIEPREDGDRSLPTPLREDRVKVLGFAQCPPGRSLSD